MFSVFLWNMLTEYFKLCPSTWKPTLRDLNILCNRNEPKQSINTAWQITEVSNSAKQKVNIPKTERQMYGCHEPYLQIFTHNLALSGSSRLLSRYPLLFVRLRLCSTVQLGLSLWPRELDKPPWSREDGAGFSIPSSETLLVERVETFSRTGGKDCKGIFHWPYC